MSDEQLRWDIERIDAIFEVYGLRLHAEAWQRIRARIAPDRERVARALVLRETVLDERGEPRDTLDYWREMADAAIAAMGETP